ncbi:MAG: hypothetical protein GXO97_02485 [Nitrospirae bacterium]|nr:hypothetical protein [Nitrospirota bacterium]
MSKIWYYISMNPQERFRKGLEKFIANKKFNSLEEVQAAVDEFTRQYNNTPLDDFCGLSPNEMWRILYHPFNSPEVVDFNLDAQVPQDAPRLKLLLRLLQKIDESEGIKSTAKGNLPRNLCRELEKEYYNEEDYSHIRSLGALMSEMEFVELHVVRIIAVMAGYIRKYRKRFVVTKRGKLLLKHGITAKEFLHILRVYTRDFNWAYSDGYPEFPIIQNSFLFTLYLLKKFGDRYSEPEFYSSLFIKAYPDVLEEATNPLYTSPEKDVKGCYEFRALRRFAIEFGFADMQRKESTYYLQKFVLKRSRFLEEFVIFK